MKLHDYLIIGLIVVVAIHFASHAGRRPVHAPGSNQRRGMGPAPSAPTASGGGAAGGSSGQSSCA
jgi:hypothetical protein